MQVIDWTLAPLVLMVFQGMIFLLFLQLNRKKLGNTALWLIGLCFFAVTTLIDSILYFSNLYYQVPYLVGVAFPISLIFPPLILGYIQSMLGKLPGKNFLWHFAPAVLCGVLLLPFYFLPNDVKLLFFFEDIENELTQSLFVLAGLVAVFLGSLLQFPIYYYLCRRALKKQKSCLEAVLSSEQHTTLSWLYTLLNISLLIWLLSCVQILLGAALQITDQLVWWANFCIGATIYLFSYFAINQQAAFRQVLKIPPTDAHANVDVIEQEFNDSRYQKSSIDQNISKQVLAEIQHHMTCDQLYLDPQLSLPMVSEKTGHSTHHVSQAINQNLNVNFFDYVNCFRVDYAKKVLLDNSRQNILDVALECGFNSKSAFYKAFKKATATTPSEFRSENRQFI